MVCGRRWSWVALLCVCVVVGGIVSAHAEGGATASHYTCPMHPQIVRDAPGRCPICGMDLVPATGHEEPHPEERGGEWPPVAVAPGLVARLGVRTAVAGRTTLWRRIDTVGYVEYDRDRITNVYSPSDGNIDGLTVTSEGERVKKGQLLFKLISPTLSSYFDETYADRDGIVAALNVIEGSFVRPTDIVLTLADLSSVWVVAEVFESQAGWVKRGQRVEVRVPYIAGRHWEGKVAYIYPDLDPETRTLKVRMRFDNKDEALRPNMQAEIILFGDPREGVVAIPREALIETGKEQRVVVAEGDGRFRPRRVEVGVERDDWVEITKGLTEGERVVVSGQFLIDSESNLKASLMRLAGPEGEGGAATGEAR